MLAGIRDREAERDHFLEGRLVYHDACGAVELTGSQLDLVHAPRDAGALDHGMVELSVRPDPAGSNLAPSRRIEREKRDPHADGRQATHHVDNVDRNSRHAGAS